MVLYPPRSVNCDPIARAYLWLEYAAFGGALRRRREAFLAEVAGVRRVLALGDGDGRFLAAFLRENPGAMVDSVDSSARMLALARARAERRVGAVAVARQVRFHCAEATAWQAPAGVRYDLIVTHFFLDCFADDAMAHLIPALTDLATPAARWLISEFRQPAAGLAAGRAKLWIAGLYRAFGFATGLTVRRLPDYRAYLVAQGWVLEREAISEWGLLTSELWAAKLPTTPR